jgi:signal transduction histidine kinase/CheY-like chemotaxis protein
MSLDAGASRSTTTRLSSGDALPWTAGSEVTLRDSERKYRSLFENMLNGFACCRMLFEGDRPTDFIYLDVNRAFEVQTGLKNVVGRRVSEVIPGIRDADPELFEIYGRVARTGRPERFETYVSALKMWFEIAVYSPEADHFVAVFDVITERKCAEASLREQAAILREMGALAHIGGWEFDPATGRGSWTDECARIHDLDLDLEPTAEFGLGFFHGESRRMIDAALDEAVRFGAPYDLLLEMITATGRHKWVRTIGSPLVQDGRIVKMRGTIQDVTELKHMEIENEKVRAQFLQSQKLESVGRLASGVAHDFNNVLTVITANLNLIQGDRRAECPHAELLDEIRDAAERAADLTRQLLAFSRQNVSQMRPVNLNEVIGRIQRMLGRIIGEDVRFELMLSASPVICRLDINQIEQILVNLAVNARDAMPRGGTFRLETALVRHDGKMEVAPRDGFVARVSAGDTGTGIAVENLSRIFEPFFTTKELGKGTGLGLAMAYGIVKQHGGDIEVRSEMGKGTTFEIFLPLCAEEDAKSVRKPVRDEAGPAEAPVVAATILLVEDEASVRRVTKRVLEKIGYRVIEAVGPDQALERARDPKLEINLVFTDIVMPGMNGLDLMKRIREFRPGMASLFMSGYAEKEILSRVSADSSIAYLSKPFTVDELARKVRSVLEGG